MLNATDLTLHYGSSQILHGVSVSAKIGEVTCIMGSNGVGKTSLLKILSGTCLLYTSPSPRDRQKSRMPSSA